MKLLCVMLMALALSACQTVNVGNIDAAIQKTAPQACDAISVGYSAFVATQLGSARDKAAVDAAFEATRAICANPSQAYATQVVTLGVQLGVIVATMRKVKVKG